MRTDWIAPRRGRKNLTQLSLAREGVITEEMAFVARREQLEPGLVRAEVARGRLVIPANVNHTGLEPIGIGIAASCKINANIGNSAVVSNIDAELEKLRVCLKHGADTVMDLSTGGNITKIRKRIIRATKLPLGTVPMYQAAIDIARQGRPFVNLTPDELFAVIRGQAQDGRQRRSPVGPFPAEPVPQRQGSEDDPDETGPDHEGGAKEGREQA